MPDSEDETLFSESLLEGGDEDELVEAESKEATTYIDPEEKILAIIEGVIEGKTSLNRLAVTDERIIFYPKGSGFFASFGKTNAISVDYDKMLTVQGKRGILLGEINIATKDNVFRFKQMAKDDVDSIARMISKRKEKGRSREISNPSRDSAFDQLKKLAELKQIGAITDEEFQEKRKKLLDTI